MNTDSLQHLHTSLSRIDPLIQRAVAGVQQNGQKPDDALRGLVVTWDEVQHALSQEPLARLWKQNGDLKLSLDLAENTPPDLPFLRLANAFGFNTLDAYILLVCLAPELDRRYERLYSFLQDDTSVRRATPNLVMNLLAGSAEQRFHVWERLTPHMPLTEFQLVTGTYNPDKPNTAGLSRILQVDARVVHHLLGQFQPDERISTAIRPAPDDPTVAVPRQVYERVCESLQTAPLVYMQGKPDLGQSETAASLCAAHDLPLLVVDAKQLVALATHQQLENPWRLVIREGYLQQSALLFESWDALLGEDTQPDADLWRAVVDYPAPVFLSGEENWEPRDLSRRRRMLRMSMSVPDYPERLATWHQHADQHNLDVPDDALSELSHKFRLPRANIYRAVQTALDNAATRGDPVKADDLYKGVQSHISLQLGHLAERIHPRFTWDDLILPSDPLSQLREITARARYAYRVHHEWGFIKRIPNAGGVSALFAGESGTGKTLSVQVIANELGLALYRIDLSAVVSKYIGETEKNLGRIFTEARASNAILFFDEADAIFGKRSEVKDARDRYANIEIAYLLQQIEDYDGVAIMATNLRQNLDEAFTRRLDFMIDFPFPDEEQREKLWVIHFPPQAPLDPAVNLREIADRYYLAGGNIRNAALASAYLAAADGGIIRNEHIQSAIRREHQKMGRLTSEL